MTYSEQSRLLAEVLQLRIDSLLDLSLVEASLLTPQEGLNRHIQSLQQHLTSQLKVLIKQIHTLASH